MNEEELNAKLKECESRITGAFNGYIFEARSLGADIIKDTRREKAAISEGAGERTNKRLVWLVVVAVLGLLIMLGSFLAGLAVVIGGFYIIYKLALKESADAAEQLRAREATINALETKRQALEKVIDKNSTI